MTELTVTKHLCLFERNSRPAEYFYGIVINHTGAYAVASVYTARLRIILLDNRGQHKHDFDVSCALSFYLHRFHGKLKDGVYQDHGA